MSSLATTLGWAAALTGVAVSLLWVISLRLRDASIADLYWGTGFVLVAWTAVGVALPAVGARGWLAAGLTTLWGLRLTLHLARRNLGHGEDRRYQAMRAGHGPRFWWVSLFTVFLLQGALLFVVSLPVQAAVALPGPPLGLLDAAGALLFSVGLAFEAIGDAQLARFKADPASRGRALDTGLWRYTRHPNYFGDACLWWGLGLLGVAAGAWWSFAGPMIMTLLLLKVSGVALLERDIAERRPGYREYVARTSAFFPWFPRKGSP